MRAQLISPLMIAEEFSAASICVESNATDGDTEIVLRAVPEDDGRRAVPA